MAIPEGSRYEGVNATKIVEEDGTVKRFLHDRGNIDVNDFAKTSRLTKKDLLDLVAFVEYDDESLWWLIAEANEENLPLDTLLKLKENTQIKLPAPNEIRSYLS
jgi:hypothetical protein